MAMDVPTSQDTDEPDDTDTSNTALGFASTEAAKSHTPPSILSRLPKRQVFLLGLVAGNALGVIASLFVIYAL